MAGLNRRQKPDPEPEEEEWVEPDHSNDQDEVEVEHINETPEERYRIIKHRGISYRMPVSVDLGSIRLFYTMDGGIYRVQEDLTCHVCDKKIKKGSKVRFILRDVEHNEPRILHEDCGPGSQSWHNFHPSELSLLLMESKERERKEKTAKLKKIFPKKMNPPVAGIKRREPKSTPKIPIEGIHRRERARPTPDGRPFREGSKTEFVYELLRKGVKFADLVKILTQKWGEKTGDETNVRLYIKNIAVRCPVKQKGDLWFAE